MNLTFSSRGWADYMHWQKTDQKVLERINTLINDVLRSPFTGIGKPEPLKHEFRGFWPRRIDQQHSLIYRVTAEAILIAQCRFHY